MIENTPARKKRVARRRALEEKAWAEKAGPVVVTVVETCIFCDARLTPADRMMRCPDCYGSLVMRL